MAGDWAGEQPETELKKRLTDNLTDIGKAIVGLLPAGSIAQYIADRIYKCQYDRTVEAVVELAKRVRRLESVNMSRDELEFLLERYVEQLARPNGEGKKRAFQDAFVGSVVEGQVDYDEQNEVIRLINELPQNAIEALVALYDMRNDASCKKKEISDGSSTRTIYNPDVERYYGNRGIDRAVLKPLFGKEVVHFLVREFLVEPEPFRLRSFGDVSDKADELVKAFSHPFSSPLAPHPSTREMVRALTKRGERIARTIWLGRMQRRASEGERVWRSPLESGQER